MAKQHTVLIVDDQDGRSTKAHLEDLDLTIIVAHPNEVTNDHLQKASLILVDFVLDDWPERDRQRTPSLRPRDGIALIGVLRSNIDHLKAGPVAFALNSGNLASLNNGRSYEGHEHSIARAVDLEWVFGKGGKRENFATAVNELAKAVHALPKQWKSDAGARSQISSLLKLPKSATWTQSATEAIDYSYPPRDILIGNGSGIAVLRWMLHVILPYPTFLLDERFVAARLRIEPEDFAKMMHSKAGMKIRKALSAFQYNGILSDFSGMRWWRAGIEQWIWDETKGKAFDSEAIELLVRRKLYRSATFTTLRDPVISINEELRPSDHLIELSDAAETRPDGWPSFADGAWIPKSAASDDAFVAIIPQREKNKLSG
jgi:hypothetical protein